MDSIFHRTSIRKFEDKIDRLSKVQKYVAGNR